MVKEVLVTVVLFIHENHMFMGVVMLLVGPMFVWPSEQLGSKILLLKFVFLGWNRAVCISWLDEIRMIQTFTTFRDGDTDCR